MLKRAIFDKKNVLVTGGAGFIGSHLCDELIKDCKVICLDNFSTGDERNIDHLLSNPDFAFINQDINEVIDLENKPKLQSFKIQFQGIQEIYHLACPMSVRNFEQNKIDTLITNSCGMKNVLDLALKYKAKFMHLSSSVVYGERSQQTEEKISESQLGITDNISKRSSYDEGKRFAETMAINFRDVYDLDIKIIRLFRTYGPRMKLNDDQLIPDFVSNALNNEDLTIFGDDNFSSSFCYVSDCIDAIIKLMESNLTGPINIGSDVDVKIADLAQKIIEITESKSKINFADKKEFLTPLCLPDIAKARNELAWMPIITLEKGLEKTIYDLQANKGLKEIKDIYN